MSEPMLEREDWDEMRRCLESGLVSSMRGHVDDFERRLCEFTGVRHSLATNTGTSALELALEAVGVSTEDEVLMPAFTFVAVANAVVRCGGIPHFVDSEEDGLGMDSLKLGHYLCQVADGADGQLRNRRTGRRIAALILVHMLGHPADSHGVQRICRSLRLPLLEDAAQALGSCRENRHVGRVGTCGILSFNGNKIVTTGGGGALLTDDADLAKSIRQMSTGTNAATGCDRAGFNCRMPSLNAALGCAQLGRVAAFVSARRQIAQRYRIAFRDNELAQAIDEPPGCRSNFWLSAIRLRPDSVRLRSEVVELGRERGIELRRAWTPMSELPMFRDCPAMDVPVAHELADSLVLLPSSQNLVQACALGSGLLDGL